MPSLKSENSGNDPTVSLVPSGGGGWGSTKEKADNVAPTSSSTPPPSTVQPAQTVNVAVVQQPPLQPPRPSAPSSYPTQAQTQQPSQNTVPTRQETTKQETNEAQAKTWGSVSQSEAGGQGKVICFSTIIHKFFLREVYSYE